MIYKQLEEIVISGKRSHYQPLYIRSELKENLQLYLLYFVYTSKRYKNNLIFTGGTCLRHFYGLQRLSEDLDFDLISEIDPEEMKIEITDFFTKRYLVNDIDISIKQKGKQILLKFPIMRKLGLANQSESDLLYIKIDLAPVHPTDYSVISDSKSSIGLNFVAKHYDLPTLMTNKIHALFERQILKGSDNKLTIKGRDYYDLLWFLKKGVRVNLELFRSLNDDVSIQLSDIENQLDKKVSDLNNKYLNDLEMDLIPFISDSEFVKSYARNYQEEYLRNKANSFS